MAFRYQQLVGILQLKTRYGLIDDLHAIADPVKICVRERPNRRRLKPAVCGSPVDFELFTAWL